jgi:hypothetical protein
MGKQWQVSGVPCESLSVLEGRDRALGRSHLVDTQGLLPDVEELPERKVCLSGDSTWTTPSFVWTCSQ